MTLDIIIPEATGEGISPGDRAKLMTPATILGVSTGAPGLSTGQVDMLDDLARRYPDLELTGTLTALNKNPELMGDTMDFLMEDETRRHYIAQQLQGNAELTAQFEDLVRNNPERVAEMLPQLEEDPTQFAKLVRGVARTPEEAHAANEAAAEANQNMLMDILTGNKTLEEAIGPALYNSLSSMPLIGPLIGMFESLLGSNGFIGQAFSGDGPFSQFMEVLGVGTDRVHDADPQDPAPESVIQPSPGANPQRVLEEPGLTGP